MKSINNQSLSSDEIQTAQRNLSDIIRTAESIKENLHSGEDSITRVIQSSCGDEGCCVDNEGVQTEQNALPTDTRRSTAVIGTNAIGTNDASEEPKRRLSTPCCIPLQSSNAALQGGRREGDDPSNRPLSAGIFGRSQNSTVYPQPSDTDIDVETGVNRVRRIRFSKAIPHRKLPDRSSNWNLVSRVVWLTSYALSLSLPSQLHPSNFILHILTITDG